MKTKICNVNACEMDVVARLMFLDSTWLGVCGKHLPILNRESLMSIEWHDDVHEVESGTSMPPRAVWADYSRRKHEIWETAVTQDEAHAAESALVTGMGV